MDTDVRVTSSWWIAGGALLLSSVLLTFATGSSGSTAPWLAILPALLVGVACVGFAVGRRRSESVTARQPVGTVALILVGVWTLVSAAIQLIPLSSGDDLDATSRFAAISDVVSFVLALIAAVMIGRAGIVPSPWNWAPAWCLAAVVVVRVITEAIAISPGIDPISGAPLLSFLSSLVGAGSVMLLGVLAITLGASERGRA